MLPLCQNHWPPSTKLLVSCDSHSQCMQKCRLHPGYYIHTQCPPPCPSSVHCTYVFTACPTRSPPRKQELVTLHTNVPLMSTKLMKSDPTNSSAFYLPKNMRFINNPHMGRVACIGLAGKVDRGHACVVGQPRLGSFARGRASCTTCSESHHDLHGQCHQDRLQH